MIKVEIKNKHEQKEITPELVERIRDVVQEAARLEGYNNAEISLALVDDEQIKRLNREYRGLEESTDVLSFPLDDELLGDIIISTEAACRQAEEYGHSLERELCYLATHGVLHIMGYDHKSEGDKRQMRQKEERVLSKFDLELNQEE